MAKLGHECRNSDANVFSNLGILTQGPRSSPWLSFVGVHKSPKTLSKIKHVCVCVLCVCVYIDTVKYYSAIKGMRYCHL